MAHVFVVDDDPAYLYIACRVLEDLGHQVTSHGSATTAWDAVVDGSRIDLLLADLRFPRGQPNGVALALHARSKHPNMPTVFMTAHADLLNSVGADLGITLLKSIPPKSLGDAVQAALGLGTPET